MVYDQKQWQCQRRKRTENGFSLNLTKKYKGHPMKNVYSKIKTISKMSFSRSTEHSCKIQVTRYAYIDTTLVCSLKTHYWSVPDTGLGLLLIGT